MIKALPLLLVLFLFCSQLQSQDYHFIDSLQLRLKNHNSNRTESRIKSSSLYDTTAANILYALSRAYWGSDLDKSMDYAKQVLSLSEQIDYKNGIGNAYNSMGVIFDYKSDYFTALDYYKKSLKIREELGDKIGIAHSYDNIGTIYYSQGIYTEALKNHLISLKIYEESGNKNGIAGTFTNLGNIYFNQGDYSNAIKYYSDAKKIFEDTGDKNGIAVSIQNIAGVNLRNKSYAEAIENYFKALKIQEEIGDKKGVSNTFGNLGAVYYQQDNYSDALSSYQSSLKIKEEIGDKGGIANIYNKIAITYIQLHKYNDALKYLKSALIMAKEIGSLELLKSAYEAMAHTYYYLENYKESLENYREFINIRDSIYNRENIQKIAQLQMQFDFDKKDALTRAEQQKKDINASNELQKQKMMRNVFIGGFGAALIFAFVFLTQRNKITAEKKISETEKERSEKLLLNILPAEAANELILTGKYQPKTYSMVTVMFADFKDFTIVSEKISAELLVNEINYCFSAFDLIIERHNLEKIKTIGDAYLCAGGLPILNYTHAIDAVNAALQMQEFIFNHRKEKALKGEITFDLRIGIHTGPVAAGIVGVKKYGYDIWGDTVNLAARMEQNSEAGRINISGTTFELIKEKFNCIPRGKIQTKNKGQVDMYFVENAII